MYCSVAEFLAEWTNEAATTQKLFDALTDSSLKQEVSPNGRTLGRIAWHIVASTPEFLSHFGVAAEHVKDAATVPASAKEIADRWRKINADAVEKVKQHLTDDALNDVQNAFGREMTNAGILSLLLKHIIHHRGQMTVLMRQAGITVPGVYGPAAEEWSQMGMEVPPY